MRAVHLHHGLAIGVRVRCAGLTVEAWSLTLPGWWCPSGFRWVAVFDPGHWFIRVFSLGLVVRF